MTLNKNPQKRRGRRLSNSQIASIVGLWVLLVYIILTQNKQINGPLVVIILMSAAFVGIPIYKEIKRRKDE